MQSETADNISWSRYASPTPGNAATVSPSALDRMDFKEIGTPVPLHAIIAEANTQMEIHKTKRLLVVTGRSKRLAVENHQVELKTLMEDHRVVGSEVKKTIGDVATAFVVAGCGSGIIVVQASNVSLD